MTKSIMRDNKKKNAKKWRKDIEYGSARWGNKTDIAPYVDPKPENNIILTQTESLHEKYAVYWGR